MPTHTPAPRRDARRDYRHFPREYTDLLTQFDRAGHAEIGPLTERDARAALRDLYRFKMFLSAALDDTPDDAHARTLFNIMGSIIMRVEPCAVASGNLTHLVALSRNPIVGFMRAAREDAP